MQYKKGFTTFFIVGALALAAVVGVISTLVYHYKTTANFGAQPALTVFQGGTGSTSPSGILIGDNGATPRLSTLTIGSNLTLSGTTLSATGGGGSGFSTTSADYYITATTTLPSITTLANLGTVKTSLTGNLQVNSGVLYTTSTSTATCSAGVSCSAFTVLGSVNPSFTNSGVTSNVAGNGISVSGSTGAVTITNTIGYPFPNNATSTLISFTGGASTTQLSVFQKLYVGGASTTTIDSSGNIVVPSGSNLTVTGKSDGCATFSTGQLNSTGSACGSGGGGNFPFSADNTYAQVVYSTSTPTLFFKSGLFASSTSYFGNGGVGSSTVQYGMDSLAWTVGELGTDNTFRISAGTALAPLPAVSIDRTSLVTTLAGGFLSQASSTIIGNATTTGTLFAGIASSTNTFGAGLASCNGTNALSWSGGLFGCVAVPQGTVTSIATNNGLTGGTITTSGTLGLATINAGVLGAVTNGVVPTSQATSTLYGTGVGGQILTWNNGVPQWLASTTYADGTGISHTFIGGQLTITNTGVTSAIGGSGISVSGSTGAVTVSANPVFTPQIDGNATGTELIFKGGFVSVGSSTINGNATTTGVSYTATASSTNLFGSGLASCNSASNALTWNAGTFGCNTITSSGGGGGFPFAADNTYAQVVYSTSTPTLWLKSGLFASSTIYDTFANGGTGLDITATGSGSNKSVLLATDQQTANQFRILDRGTSFSLQTITAGIALSFGVGNAVTETIDGTSGVHTFTDGFLSAASSTISAAFGLPSLSQGFAYIGSGAFVQSAASSSLFGYTPPSNATTLTIAGTANQITSSAGAQDLTANRAWTLSLPSLVLFPGNASTTQISAAQGFFNSFVATSTTATSSVAFGLNVATSGGCLAVNGTCITSSISQIGAFKAAVNYATTAALPANTYLSGVLTEVGTGALSVDGASPAIGNRILVKNEVTQTNNGIYVVTATGSGIAAYVLTRASDFNTNADIYPGVSTYVLSGTANSDDVWTLTTPAPVVLDTSNLTFVESANGNITLPITVANGGTGQTTMSSAQLLYGNGTAALSSVATSSFAVSSGLSYSGIFGALVGGTGGTLSQNEHHSFTYATTTWTGTTTIPLESGYGEIWNTIQCFTDTGTLNVQVGYGTASTTMLNASTTNGTFNYTSNNTMTSGNMVKVDIGTPASAPTKINCTEKDTY